MFEQIIADYASNGTADEIKAEISAYVSKVTKKQTLARALLVEGLKWVDWDQVVSAQLQAWDVVQADGTLDTRTLKTSDPAVVYVISLRGLYYDMTKLIHSEPVKSWRGVDGGIPEAVKLARVDRLRAYMNPLWSDHGTVLKAMNKVTSAYFKITDDNFLHLVSQHGATVIIGTVYDRHDANLTAAKYLINTGLVGWFCGE
jgi:hypothetical protein